MSGAAGRGRVTCRDHLAGTAGARVTGGRVAIGRRFRAGDRRTRPPVPSDGRCERRTDDAITGGNRAAGRPHLVLRHRRDAPSSVLDRRRYHAGGAPKPEGCLHPYCTCRQVHLFAERGLVMCVCEGKPRRRGRARSSGSRGRLVWVTTPEVGWQRVPRTLWGREYVQFKTAQASGFSPARFSALRACWGGGLGGCRSPRCGELTSLARSCHR